MRRRETSNFKIGEVGVGSAYPVSIQSMTNTDTRNAERDFAANWTIGRGRLSIGAGSCA